MGTKVLGPEGATSACVLFDDQPKLQVEVFSPRATTKPLNSPQP